jgi:hypothetical protein
LQLAASSRCKNAKTQKRKSSEENAKKQQRSSEEAEIEDLLLSSITTKSKFNFIKINKLRCQGSNEIIYNFF